MFEFNKHRNNITWTIENRIVFSDGQYWHNFDITAFDNGHQEIYQKTEIMLPNQPIADDWWIELGKKVKEMFEVIELKRKLL